MGKIKILVVDDDQAVVIKENIEDFTFQGIDCQIETSISITEAKEKISRLKKKKQFYDIMIIDMKMPNSDEEGLEIFKMQLYCIKIVLTAIPTIQNCVKCLKKGAFDYIEKNSVAYEPYEKLKESMTNGLKERLREKETPFMKWINENHPNLTRDYGGENIAVIDDIVVDSDKNYNVLIKRVKKRYPFFQPNVINIPGDLD
jgi:DNA-binding NtrC family response regulator